MVQIVIEIVHCVKKLVGCTGAHPTDQPARRVRPVPRLCRGLTACRVAAQVAVSWPCATRKHGLVVA